MNTLNQQMDSSFAKERATNNSNLSSSENNLNGFNTDLINTTKRMNSTVTFKEFENDESYENYINNLFSNCNEKNFVSDSIKDLKEKNLNEIDSQKKLSQESFHTNDENIIIPNSENATPFDRSIDYCNSYLGSSLQYKSSNKLNISSLIPQVHNLNKSLSLERNIDINSTSLLRVSKDPRINIENVKNIVMAKISFLNLDTLRLYNNYYGCFQEFSLDDILIEINKAIPSQIRSNLEPSDLRKLYDAIRLDPNIQLKPELNNSSKYLINCINGVLNLNSFFNNDYRIFEHSTNYRFINCINASYFEKFNISNSNFERFIYTVTGGSIELINLIQEVLGYAFSTLNNAKKAFLLYGESNSGKSVLLNVISTICGENNVSNIPLQNLSKENYVAELYGKLINIFSELPDKGIDDTGMFKALVSETDKIIARKLFKNPFSFYNKCKLFFATNNLPEIKSVSTKDNTAFFNRLIIIPFKYSVPENLQDKDLVHKLIYEKDLIFSWAIDGLIRYISNGYKFTECSESNFILNHYSKNSNFILSFINEKCLFDNNSYVHFDKLIESLINYCNENFIDMPSNKDKQYLKNILKEKYKLDYKRLNRKDGNKYGFEGLRIL